MAVPGGSYLLLFSNPVKQFYILLTPLRVMHYCPDSYDVFLQNSSFHCLLYVFSQSVSSVGATIERPPAVLACARRRVVDARHGVQALLRHRTSSAAVRRSRDWPVRVRQHGHVAAFVTCPQLRPWVAPTLSRAYPYPSHQTSSNLETGVHLLFLAEIFPSLLRPHGTKTMYLCRSYVGDKNSVDDSVFHFNSITLLRINYIHIIRKKIIQYKYTTMWTVWMWFPTELEQVYIQ